MTKSSRRAQMCGITGGPGSARIAIDAMLTDVFPRVRSVSHPQTWVERAAEAEDAVSKLQTKYATDRVGQRL